MFGMDFAAVAEAIGRAPTTCRKLASRARLCVHDARPRFPVAPEQGMTFAAAFFAASRSGDLTALRDMLAEHILVCADGGGKVPTTQAPVVGFSAVLAPHARLARYFRQYPSQLIRYVMIDGLPGFITIEHDRVVQTTALQVENGKAVSIFVTRNPDKLRRMPFGTVN